MTGEEFERLPEAIWLLVTEYYAGKNVFYGVVRYEKAGLSDGVRCGSERYSPSYRSPSFEELYVRLCAAGIAGTSFARTHFNNSAPPFISAHALDVFPIREYAYGRN